MKNSLGSNIVKKSKFKIGDKVSIVNYGHPICATEDVGSQFKNFPQISEYENGMAWFDIRPEWVGRKAIIKDVEYRENGGYWAYKTTLFSWATEGQLKKIGRAGYASKIVKNIGI